MHKAVLGRVVVDEAESCAGVLGFVLSIGLCKLVVDRLPKAKEEVVDLKALVQKAVLKRDAAFTASQTI